VHPESEGGSEGTLVFPANQITPINRMIDPLTAG
jgi:hypothetical protein